MAAFEPTRGPAARWPEVSTVRTTTQTVVCSGAAVKQVDKQQSAGPVVKVAPRYPGLTAEVAVAPATAEVHPARKLVLIFEAAAEPVVR